MTHPMRHDPPPGLLQGGMGAYVSGWRLARAVSQQGGLGTVSGTALDTVIARILMEGDPGGHIRRAAHHFPLPEIAGRVIQKWYVEGGKPKGEPYRNVPAWKPRPKRELIELTIFANFCEIWLAKEGNSGWVGINYLEKIQMPHLYSLYGALLAGVDAVLMGAGIPDQIPGVLDALGEHQPAEYRLSSVGGAISMHFDPSELWEGAAPPDIRRPDFFPIIASNALAQRLSRLKVSGFIVEGPGAGGHNAPPRSLDPETGQKVYGPKDEVDWLKLNAVGVRYWIADRQATPEGLEKARLLGAYGIQVGTIFALCEESGLRSDLKQKMRQDGFRGDLTVATDYRGSPTGFPFKVARLSDTLSEPNDYSERRRVCNLGYLVTTVLLPDGNCVVRCPSEPLEDYLRKGGDFEDTQGRKCLCNSLMANVGLPQSYNGGRIEKPLLTIGDAVGSEEVALQGDAHFLRRLSDSHGKSYTAEQAYRYLIGNFR